MTAETEVSLSTDAPAGPVAHPPKSQAEEIKKFLGVGLPFMIGFLLSTFALNACINAYLRRNGMRGGLGGEVQTAIEMVQHKPMAVRKIFLGDSVARQLFRPGTEPDPQVRFLTTNQAITVAGQCYLAENAFKQCPHIKDVYLVYLPAAWRNNMPTEFTHDYFCGHFHQFKQVVEVFRVKRDIELSFAHLGRWLWPDIMAANSLSRPALAMDPAGLFAVHKSAAPPPDPERLLTELSGLVEPPMPEILPEPFRHRAIYLSPVSRYFLNRLREDCRKRGIRLHVLPCPISVEKTFFIEVDPEHIYDGPIIDDIPADQLIDPVHFKDPFIAPARARFIQMYGLDFLK